MPGRRWIQEEDNLISSVYPTGDWSALTALNRSRRSIYCRAVTLGVKMGSAARTEVALKQGRGKNNAKFRGCGRIAAAYVTRLRTRRKRECRVTPEYLESIVVDVCPFSGRRLTYQTYNEDWGTTASIDRIDPTKGYVPGNVRWMHKDVNRMKWNMRDAEFMDWMLVIEMYCRGKGVDDLAFKDTLRGDQLSFVPKIKRFKGYGRVTGARISSLRYWAKDRNLPHPLLDGTIENCRYLDELIPAVCPFSGHELTFPTYSKETFTTASLDRIDSKQGYIKGNVRWIHRAVNLMRVDMTDDVFLTLVRDIAANGPRPN